MVGITVLRDQRLKRFVQLGITVLKDPNNVQFVRLETIVFKAPQLQRLVKAATTAFLVKNRAQFAPQVMNAYTHISLPFSVTQGIIAQLDKQTAHFVLAVVTVSLAVMLPFLYLEDTTVLREVQGTQLVQVVIIAR